MSVTYQDNLSRVKAKVAALDIPIMKKFSAWVDPFRFQKKTYAISEYAAPT